jgi:hypothetical protein
MLPVIKQLFKSQHFYDVANKGVMIKSPIDLIVGLIRTMNVDTNTATGIDKQYFVWRYFQDYAGGYLEQGIGAPPNVAGWKAYYQEPTYYQNWINSETIQRRATLLTSFLNGFTPYSSGVNVKANLIAYVQQFGNTIVADPNLLVNEVVKNLLPKDILATYKTTQLKQLDLLNGQADIYWTNAWNTYVSTPGNTTNTNVVNARLKSLFTAIMQLAEFQLM